MTQSRLLQDEIQTKEVRRLALWFASRPGARHIATINALEIAMKYNRYPDESGPADQDKTDDAYWEGDDE